MARILVTGANRGIGLELCRQFAARNDEVIATCHAQSDELRELRVRVIEGIEVTSDEAVENLAVQLRGLPVDVLVNNAGILTEESLGEMNFDRVHAQLEVNALGPLRVSCALLPNLLAGAKLVLITSRMGSIGDNSSGGMYGYRMSKVALNMAGKSLAVDLRARGIAVGIFHPGLVSTRMTEFSGISPVEAASNLIARIDALTLETSGQFFHASGESLPW